jgi:hypothetical protein
VAVKANPADVLSAQEGKIRVVNYEVLMDFGRVRGDLFLEKGISQIEKKLVVEIKKERQEMIQKILSLPDIKRKIRRKKLSKLTIVKSSYARLKTLFQKCGLVPKVGPEDKYFLAASRKAAGFSIGQIAKQSGMSYKVVATLEKNDSPDKRKVSNYLGAIASLSGVRAISYPKPVVINNNKYN